MSIEICSDCTRAVDTDFKEVYYLDDEAVCEHCYFHNYPETVARKDHEMGAGQDCNPYKYDADPLSNYQRYAWEMHCLHNKEFMTIRQQIETFFRRDH